RGMSSGTKGLRSLRTTSYTSLVLRSRTPRMYSSLRSSKPAIVASLIMPRSATTQTRPMANRRRRRSTTARSVVRPAALVHDDPEHHLVKVRPVVLALALFPERVAAAAFEVERRGVHEHHGELAEQIAPALKQLFLDEV